MVTKKGRCDDHKPVAWKSSAGKTTTERGYGHSWAKVRRLALERDLYLCVICSRNGRTTKAVDVDHVVKKASGGTDDIDNTQSLCRSCHKEKTNKER